MLKQMRSNMKKENLERARIGGRGWEGKGGREERRERKELL